LRGVALDDPEPFDTPNFGAPRVALTATTAIALSGLLFQVHPGTPSFRASTVGRTWKSGAPRLRTCLVGAQATPGRVWGRPSRVRAFRLQHRQSSCRRNRPGAFRDLPHETEICFRWPLRAPLRAQGNLASREVPAVRQPRSLRRPRAASARRRRPDRVHSLAASLSATARPTLTHSGRPTASAGGARRAAPPIARRPSMGLGPHRGALLPARLAGPSPRA